MKVIQKYFLAILPPETFRREVEMLKKEIREKYGIKYALKSPVHITVKMPFSYNEAKESKLFGQLNEFCSTQEAFELHVRGVDTFGKRVIFLDVEKQNKLTDFQEQLSKFCKREMNMISELSDRNFHPHMTVAFKDLKPQYFEEVLKLTKSKKLTCKFDVNQLCLLKRISGKWEIDKWFDLGKTE